MKYSHKLWLGGALVIATLFVWIQYRASTSGVEISEEQLAEEIEAALAEEQTRPLESSAKEVQSEENREETEGVEATSSATSSIERGSTTTATEAMTDTNRETDPADAMQATGAEVPVDSVGESLQTMLVAGGCFWCVEADLEKVAGVRTVISGYAGGTTEQPTYQNYARGGHREVVLVLYDAQTVSYGQLLEYAIKHMDPTDSEGSFGDRGVEYSPAIYYESNAEETEARRVIKALDELNVYDDSIALAIEPRTRFFSAEDYHQDYYKKNPIRYQGYRLASGRDAFIREHWDDRAGEFTVTADTRALSTTLMQEIEKQWGDFQKPDEETLKARLTEMQYRVTQKDATERAFQNEYHDNKEDGLYVDVVSGEPLFSSRDKFDSGTGWPSFTKPLYPDAVQEHKDYKLILPRTEIRSTYADSHLGHVFNDAPQELGGIRYCMNSASLRFIPKDKLEAEGYGSFVTLFE